MDALCLPPARLAAGALPGLAQLQPFMQAGPGAALCSRGSLLAMQQKQGSFLWLFLRPSPLCLCSSVVWGASAQPTVRFCVCPPVLVPLSWVPVWISFVHNFSWCVKASRPPSSGLTVPCFRGWDPQTVIQRLPCPLGSHQLMGKVVFKLDTCLSIPPAALLGDGPPSSRGDGRDW